MRASRHEIDEAGMIPCMLGVIRIEEHTLALAFDSRQMDLAAFELNPRYLGSQRSFMLTQLA